MTVMRNLLCALYLLANGVAFAQAYPTKPIRMLVPYPPGGGVDIAARTVGLKIGEALGQQIIVDNRGGASGNIARESPCSKPASRSSSAKRARCSITAAASAAASTNTLG